VPTVEAPSAMPSTSLCLPCLAMGKPSKVVATAEDVPGIFIRIAVTPPPNMPPVKMEVRNSIAVRKSKASVAGRKMAMAMEVCRPGMQPKTSPIRRPTGTTSHGCQEELRRSRAPATAEKSIIDASQNELRQRIVQEPTEHQRHDHCEC